MNPIDILLIEDNPGDVLLAREALTNGGGDHLVRTAPDGQSALALLRCASERGTLPDLVLLDVHLPGMSGHDVLTEIKSDPDLEALPVVMLSSSRAESDVRGSYERHASCYVAKPIVLDDYFDVVRSIEDFWCSTVQLPKKR